jgi:diguanylate cyclase (GGDEF)-like protein/PAS domain S-box-containing protein
MSMRPSLVPSPLWTVRPHVSPHGPPPLDADALHADSAVRLFEQVADAGLWRLDLASGVLHVSRWLRAWLGVSGPVRARTNRVAQPWRARVRAHVRACARRGDPFDCLAQLSTREGQQWARILGQAVRGAGGDILGVEGVVQALSPQAEADGAVVTVDALGRLNYLNAQAERLLARPATSLQGRSIWSLFQRTARVEVEAAVRAALAQGQPLALEALEAGQTQWLALEGVAFADGLALKIQDVTARREAQAHLRLLEESIARLNDFVLITEAGPFDEPGPRIVFVNEAFEMRTGYRRQEVLGRSPRFLQGPQTQRERLDRIHQAIVRWQPVRVDLINYRKDGEPFWVDLDISPVWDASRRLTHWVAVGRDVTQRQATEQRIRHLAFHDALTGLPNRQLLLERLHTAFERRAGPHGGALIFIDLDHFKALNDTRGHDQGDRLLQQVAARLQACVSHGDTVARLGGDEFVILLAPRSDGPRAVAKAATAVAHRVRRALGAPYPLPGGLHPGTCSIGVTVFESQPAPVDVLMKQADQAMYQAKRAGGDRVCFFDPRRQSLA